MQLKNLKSITFQSPADSLARPADLHLQTDWIFQEDRRELSGGIAILAQDGRAFFLELLAHPVDIVGDEAIVMDAVPVHRFDQLNRR